MEVNVERLRELRRRRVLTLRELGARADVSYATIHRLETGHKQARPSTIRKLARPFGVEPEELLTWEDV